MGERAGRRLAWLLAVAGAVAAGCDDGESGQGQDAPDRGPGIAGDAAPSDGGRDVDARPAGEDAGPDAAPPPAACADGVDNDRDDRVDFPADPGCAGEDDDDELDPPETECADGVDNDNDGRADLEDPDCEGPRDRTESGFDPVTACQNDRDDDGDGRVDFPYDPGCEAAGDGDEDDLEVPPACADGLDDDGDGRTDWPEDPGCAGAGDGDEADLDPAPACANGVDDDGDGLTDWPADFGCLGAGESNEAGGCGTTRPTLLLTDGAPVDADTSTGLAGDAASCGGAEGPSLVFEYHLERPLDALVFTTAFPETRVPTALAVRSSCNGAELACDAGGAQGAPGSTVRVPQPLPGTYFVFVDTRAAEGGAVRLGVERFAAPACRDGLDNDGDGAIDRRDPGCDSLADGDEADPAERPACSNRIDDDTDGRTDFPADPACLAAGGASEVEACGAGVGAEELVLPMPARVMGAFGPEDALDDTCGGEDLGPEKVYTFFLPQAATVVASTQHPGTVGRTALTLRSDCDDVATEAACARGTDVAPGARVEVRVLPAGRHYLIVEPHGEPAAFELSLEARLLGPACANGLDDDGDGAVDGEDRGCAAADDDEAGDADAACGNGADDDGDGRVDFPSDPGCFGLGDDDEADPASAPACANGIDDDGDGRADFPDDPGCQGRGDVREDDPARTPACSDRADNDEDGLIDEPDDPGCAGPGDWSEAEGAGVPTCANGRDDDGDGLADWPADPGCRGRGDDDEADPAEAPRCANGRDDDADGFTDWPEDAGCGWASDSDEIDPVPPARCHNRFDDDRDGLVDWPDDPGCSAAGDNDESNPPLCGNGQDDDGDGRLDLADPGCESRGDNDERDPDPLPECGNGLDDDMDGQTDWPADADCPAAGARNEARACSLDVETIEVGQAGGRFEVPLSMRANATRGSCVGEFRDMAEVVLVIRLDQPSDVVVETSGGDGDPYLFARRDCDDGGTEIACDDDGGNGLDSRIAMTGLARGTYFVFVDGRRDGAITASVTITSNITECSDEADNDDDALVDLLDPGCTGPRDASEVDPAVPPVCANGADDDGDGRTDYPADPECGAAGGGAEVARCELAEVVELGQEGGRLSLNTAGAGDNYAGDACGSDGAPERVVALTLRVASRVTLETDDSSEDTILYVRSDCDDVATELDCDDDGGDSPLSRLEFDRLEAGTYFVFVDGFNDDDFGPVDLVATVTALVEACADGEDNDRDGRIDADDPGCTGADDGDETDPAELPACADGVDNDDDGFVDLADLACATAGGDEEAQFCAERRAVDLTDTGGAIVDNTELADADVTLACGGRGAGDAVFRFRVKEDQAGGTLVASIANPGTAIDGAVVSVRRFCDDPDTELACADGEGGTVTLPDARSGDYYIVVDGVGAPLVTSRASAIELPSPGPDGEGTYTPGRLFSPPDADGSDAWTPESGETLGGVSLWHENVPTGLSLVPGDRRVNVNGLLVRVLTDFAAPTVLRVRLLPAGDDSGPLFIESLSTLAESADVAEVRQMAVGDVQLPYFVTDHDGFVDSTQVVFALVPSRVDQVAGVQYRLIGEQAVRMRGAQIDLPAALYFAPGYAPAADVAEAIAADLFYPGDRESSGAIELTVELRP